MNDEETQELIQARNKGRKKDLRIRESDGMLMQDGRMYAPNDAELKEEILDEAHVSAYAMHPGEYLSYRLIKKKSEHLFNVKKNVLLRDYVKRFKVEKAKIVRYDDSIASAAFQKKLLVDHRLFEEIVMKEYLTLADSFTLAEKHALWDEARRAEKAPEQPQKESAVAPKKKDMKQSSKNSTSENQLLSFLDAYLGYNQIAMYEPDNEKTAFVIERGTYCYKVMPFGLKNVRATYLRLANIMFKKQIGVTIEVYVDDILVKGK
ncbi:uncharacterized protein LOC126633860 [Malus sylvestris]|uniref:uncharacterized protein LOC126633860 n=1 Tax=Malus sylvestris TaxID=3752 RepID=UPI0021AC9D57|nr:uncharacterized protein LOC126633860 [Malus sylvestris]